MRAVFFYSAYESRGVFQGMQDCSGAYRKMTNKLGKLSFTDNRLRFSRW